jgi:hypothetical protein
VVPLTESSIRLSRDDFPPTLELVMWETSGYQTSYLNRSMTMGGDGQDTEGPGFIPYFHFWL